MIEPTSEQIQAWAETVADFRRVMGEDYDILRVFHFIEGLVREKGFAPNMKIAGQGVLDAVIYGEAMYIMEPHKRK
jgi:hypothetical protein